MPTSNPPVSVSLCLNVNKGANVDTNITLYPNTTQYPNGNPTATGSWPMSVELASGTTFVDDFSIVYPNDDRGNAGGNYTVTISLPDGYTFAQGPGTVAVPGATPEQQNYEDGIVWLNGQGSLKQLTAKIKQGNLELKFKKAANENWADWRYQYAFVVVESASGAVMASPDPDFNTGSNGSNPP
jgi:hypothetical protein